MIRIEVTTPDGTVHSAAGVVVSCYGWVNLYDNGRIIAKGNSLNHAIQIYIQSLTLNQHGNNTNR
jgi:hypothetical protein